ncbi:hypothetical protein HIM_00393 [Hirsutella minnesotensis 3608]|nr:hypothetical protein HIM_00393 [Hirsutella minnesotensis 3608]
MAPSAGSSLKLPSGFTAIRDVLDGKVRAGVPVTVIGVVTDFRAPIETKGSDWKCQIQLYDRSVEDEYQDSLIFNIFRPLEGMPDAKLGDIIVIRSAKTQHHNVDTVSLLSSWTSIIRVYDASKLSEGRDASLALRRGRGKVSTSPDRVESQLVSTLYRTVNKDRLPSESDFESRKIMSVNVRNKFSELKDVKDGQFVDVTVRIVKEPYDMGDRTTVWVSDFTENEKFYNYSIANDVTSEGQVGDTYGYLKPFQNSAKKTDWTGPFGKHSLQVTVWPPHTSVIFDKRLTRGSWVSLRNLHIKFGHNGLYLEGFLREDRHAQGPKLNIVPLWVNPEETKDPESLTEELKSSIKRKMQYEKSTKRALKELDEAAEAGRKRKANLQSSDEPPKKKKGPSKQLRKARRELERERAKSALIPNLNKNGKMLVQVVFMLSEANFSVKCENEGKATSCIADILEPVKVNTVVNGQATTLRLPFANTKHRAYVRVVDFRPAILEDFARPRKFSEADVLSDVESSSESGSSASDSATEDSRMTSFVTRTTDSTIWEWRFFLKLQDALVEDGKEKKSFWVFVDNSAAQCLLSRDASDLRRDGEALEAIKEQLFLLWGDVQERKAKMAQKTSRRPIDQPPDDSSDEEGAAQKQKAADEPSNRPFSCCISQYGIKVSEPDKTKADAGPGKRWERVFAMFGVKIAQV